jgi:lipoyl synthase
MSNTCTPASQKRERAQKKLSRIPIKVDNPTNKLPKPPWLRIKLPPAEKIQAIKTLLRDNQMVTVCEEASCPNLAECFSHGTATFMIMGLDCTRRCSFCDVGHGRPKPLDTNEPSNLAKTVQTMGLKFVVITSVDRDDLRDGGAQHFVDCIQAVRQTNPHTQVEILVPDFRGRMEKALDILANAPADVFNHNIETVPRLYRACRPGSDYQHSLNLLQTHKQRHPHVPTKSGIMLGLGETDDEVIDVLKDLRQHNVDRITLGQYLQPTEHHTAVARYVSPEQFKIFETTAYNIGFNHVASGPLVRSSYHADKQAAGEAI